MTLLDWFALAVFVGLWFGYEPILSAVSRRSGAVSRDMTDIRAAWMAAAMKREMRLVDSQLIGHSINSASFFASANLILIAAVGGALFSADVSLSRAAALGLETDARQMEVRLGLVLLALARGFLEFIWSIRQMNYVLALIGAAPEQADAETRDRYAEAATGVLNPALSTFSQGVRGYYFALAGGAWLFGAWAFLAATLASTILLLFRQSHSPAAKGVRRAKVELATEAAAAQHRPTEPVSTGPTEAEALKA